MGRTLDIFEKLLGGFDQYHGSDLKFIADRHGIEEPLDAVYMTGSLLFALKSKFMSQIDEILDNEEIADFADKFNNISNDEKYWWMKTYDEGSSLIYPLFEKVSRWVVKDNGLTTKQKICVDLYLLIALVEKWRNIFGEKSDDKIFFVTLIDNLIEKLHVWYYEETSMPIMRHYPWMTNLSEKELAQGLPPIFKLTTMRGKSPKSDLMSMLDREVYLRYVPLDELVRTFGFEEVLPQKMHASKQRRSILNFIKNAGTTIHHICFSFCLDIKTAKNRLAELFDKGLLESTNKRKPYSGFLIAKPRLVTAEIAEILDVKESKPVLPGPTLRPGPTLGPPPSSGGFKVLGNKKIRGGSGLDTSKGGGSKPNKASKAKNSALVKRVAVCLDKIAEEDGKGVHHKHVYLFVGVTTTKKVKAKEPSVATETDVKLKKATELGDLFYPKVDKIVGGKSETFIRELLKEQKYRGSNLFKHPAFQKFVELFGKEAWERKKGNRHKTFKSSSKMDGKPSEEIAPWLVDHMPKKIKTMLPVQEKKYGLKSS